MHRHIKLKQAWQLFGFFFFIVVTIIGASQLRIVREYFSKASGEPANIQVDTKRVVGPMPRPWRNLAQGGESHNWRLEPLVGQVRTLHPEYIRLDHIYDFYDIVGGSSGNLTFDFSKLDLVLNDIRATGAKPYIALSYMPPAIASGDLVSAPSNYADWQLVVQKTVEHISGTRGFEDVYYEVWNEPDLFGGWKYYGEKSYLSLYTASARGAANARGVKAFKIGGPATTALYKNWFDALARHALANNLRLDFFSWHRYSTDINQYRKDMTEIRTWLAEYPQLEATMELHITEWGHDSEVDGGYDTAYGAAHTVAGAMEMVGIVERAFVFEIQDGKHPEDKKYWGRWGLFTANEVGVSAKPRFRALQLLEKLADQRLVLLGKGTWVKALAAKKDEGQYQVLLSNYDPQGRNSETVPITFTNLEPGTFTITKEYLDGRRTSETVATTEASLRTDVPMAASNVVLVEISSQ